MLTQIPALANDKASMPDHVQVPLKAPMQVPGPASEDILQQYVGELQALGAQAQTTEKGDHLFSNF